MRLAPYLLYSSMLPGNLRTAAAGAIGALVHLAASILPWGINRRRVVTTNDGKPGERSFASLPPAFPAQDSKGARETTMRVLPTNDKR